METSNRGLVVGGFYNWKNQPERLIYLGRKQFGWQFLHQFALVDSPQEVRYEVTSGYLSYIEETGRAEQDLVEINKALEDRMAIAGINPLRMGKALRFAELYGSDLRTVGVVTYKPTNPDIAAHNATIDKRRKEKLQARRERRSYK